MVNNKSSRGKIRNVILSGIVHFKVQKPHKINLIQTLFFSKYLFSKFSYVNYSLINWVVLINGKEEPRVKYEWGKRWEELLFNIFRAELDLNW